jgi:hypothetical protein
MLILDGLTYKTIRITDVAVERRLAWLRCGTRKVRAGPGRYKRPAGGFVPQPWEELAAAYRELGLNRDARIIMLYKHRERNRSMRWRDRWFEKLWNYLQDGLLGYGYVPWRAFLWIITLWAIGTVYFDIKSPLPTQSGGNVPPFSVVDSLRYTLDLLLPGVHAGGSDAWYLDGGFGKAFALALTLLGWVLGLTAVAGITRAVRKD